MTWNYIHIQLQSWGKKGEPRPYPISDEEVEGVRQSINEPESNWKEVIGSPTMFAAIHEKYPPLIMLMWKIK